MTRTWRGTLFLTGLAGLAACSNAMNPTPSTRLISVAPAGGTTGIAVNTAITMHFNGPMMMSGDSEIMLHQGDVTGTVVPCTRTWSADSMTLTMTPLSPLAAGTHYTIHLDAGMMDAGGHSIDMTTHGIGMGGQCMGGGGGMMMGNVCTEGMVFGFTTS
jgi:hypothetical protein